MSKRMSRFCGAGCEAAAFARMRVLNCVSEARTQVREQGLNCGRYKRTTRGKQNWKNKGF